MTTLRALIAAGLVVGLFGAAVAKLPPPAPPTDAQKAAAEEKKAKDAAAAEAAKAAQARAEDRVAARYFADMKAKGKAVAPPQMVSAAPAAGAVTTAQGNTPASGRPGQSADAKGPAKPPSKAAAATGPGAAKDSSKK